MAISVCSMRRACLDAAAHYNRRALDAQGTPDAQAWQAAAQDAQRAAAILRTVESEARRRALLLLHNAGLHPFADALQTGDVARCLDLPDR